MTPAAAIAALDRQLAMHGENVILRRTNSTTGQVTVRAKCRGYRPSEVAGIIMAGDTLVILSPTDAGAFGAPPENGFVVVDGKPRRVISSLPVRIDGEIVRFEAQVRG